eukprot:scaffold46479_cov69-Phaeocystis_antarctica.AAC.3
MLPQQLPCRGVLLPLGPHECRAAGDVLQRGVGLGVEQRLHHCGMVFVSSAHQGGHAEGALQVDARAALQQHPHHSRVPSRGGPYQHRHVVQHHRLRPSIGGHFQQRCAFVLCAARFHAPAPVQPRSHRLRIALARRD